jgi:hypothetical protein
MNWLAGWKVAYAAMGAASFLWGAALLFVHIDEAPVGHDGTAGGPGGGAANGFALGTVVLFFWIVTLGGLVYRINIVALPAFLEFKAGFLASALHDLLNLPVAAATTTMAAASLTSAHPTIRTAAARSRRANTRRRLVPHSRLASGTPIRLEPRTAAGAKSHTMSHCAAPVPPRWAWTS